jgi:hypothetical protein
VKLAVSADAAREVHGSFTAQRTLVHDDNQTTRLPSAVYRLRKVREISDHLNAKTNPVFLRLKLKS